MINDGFRFAVAKILFRTICFVGGICFYFSIAHGETCPRVKSTNIVGTYDRQNDASFARILEEIKKLKLHSSCTSEETREYVTKFFWLVKHQKTYHSDDPQVDILTTNIQKAGVDKFNILLEMFGTHVYFDEAIRRLSKNEHKQLIISNLRYNYDLVEIVNKQGWEEDAKAVLFAELENPKYELPPAWFVAISLLQKNRKDMSDLIIENWKKYKTCKNDEAVFAATVMAISYGNLEALEFAIKSLQDEAVEGQAIEKSQAVLSNVESCVSPEKYRHEVLKYLLFDGSNKEVKQWFAENKFKLVFNEVTKKFEKIGNNP